MTAFIGWLAALIDVGQFLPQGAQTIRQRRDHKALAGLSVWSWTLATTQGVLWVVYGFATDHLPVAVPNLVITPICAVVLVLAVRGRRMTPGAAAASES